MDTLGQLVFVHEFRSQSSNLRGNFLVISLSKSYRISEGMVIINPPRILSMSTATTPHSPSTPKRARLLVVLQF